MPQQGSNKMQGHLLTMAEAGEVLFGDNTERGRKRAAYLIKTQNIKTIKNGRQTLVRRDILDKAFGIDDGSEDS